MVARRQALRGKASRQRHVRSSSVVLVLIAIFKLLKALLLITVGIGALRLLHTDIAATAMHWARTLRVDPDDRFIHGMLVKIFRTTPAQLKELSAGTFVYAGLFLVEGIGLLFRKRWAEYFTIITTGGLIPIEVFELARHFGAAKLAVLFVNVLIVIYLVERIRSH